MIPYRPAAVEILAIDQVRNDVTSLTLRLLERERVDPPLVPSSLVPLTGSWRVILELHRIVDGRGDTWTFATSDQRSPTPEPGSELGLQPWWTADVLEIVTDLSRRWTGAPFDDTAEDFCPLCWASRDAGDPALTDGRDWICPACHEKYVVNDYLGLRFQPDTG